MPDLLDIAYPPDVNTLVTDVQHAGAHGVGLYCINLSAPDTVQTADYARQVAGRVRVVPIITPGQTPPPVDGVPAALTAWWAGGPVALDIEQPGVDMPDPAWVQALCNALTAGGYDPWVYCNKGTRATYPWGKWWVADWAATTDATGWVAWQDTDQFIAQSSTRYDASYLDPSALTGGSMSDVTMGWLNAGGTAPGQPDFPHTVAETLKVTQALYNMLNESNATEAAIKAELDAIKGELNAGNNPDVMAVVGRIENALKAA